MGSGDAGTDAPGGPLVGEVLELRIGPVAHGGHWVSRTSQGQVVFVRHALGGELVRAVITDAGGRFLRADVRDVLEPSPARVEAPCPLAHADGCGGCDFQHVELGEQRALKATVVAEQLRRLAGIDWPVECEAVPGDDRGLHWRTRMQYVDLGSGRRGLRKHRSHEVVEVADCPIAREDARTSVVTEVGGRTRRVARAGAVTERVLGHAFEVEGDGFWQVHPGAPTALVEAVLGQLSPRAGERALDLYAGVGLFTVFLAEAVGESGRVVAVESDAGAAAYAVANVANAAGAGRVEVAGDRVDRWLRRGRDRFDLVVLDPPRVGAKRAVVTTVAQRGPRAISYVACDPAALARDVGYFAECGYQLVELRCFDLFPMTHHVECVALLTRR